jgi:hypothetical protein
MFLKEKCMKKFLMLCALCVLAVTAFAEASFQQIESLIEQKQYRAAEQGLVEIIKNHPQSAKAYYAMAQAQAGLGNQDKAQFALDKARGLDPELKFASTGNVQNLQTAITPQAAKIEPVQEHDYSWLKWVLALGVVGLAVWYHKSEEAKKKEREEREKAAEEGRALREKYAADFKRKCEEDAAKKAAEPKPAVATQAPAGPAPSQPAPTYVTPTYAPAPTQTVIHHHDDSNALMNAVIMNDILSHNRHDSTRIVEREVIREVPAPAPAPQRDSSWDTPAPSRSSSWDSGSSSSSSSSWDSSSSSSSSSWDSGSSSSDSSSSWD